MPKIILLSLIISFSALFPQENVPYTYPRDTTYSLKLAYKHHKKYHPFIKPVVYKSTGGSLLASVIYDIPQKRPLKLDIFSVPQSGEAKPAVVFVHGGGWSSGDKSMMHPLADDLAKKGYITITVEYRLSPEAPYPAAVNDIKSALNWIITNSKTYHIDPDRIAILGCSAGAQLAALVGLTFDTERKNDPQKHIGAVINIDGIMDFTAAEARKFEDDPKRESTPAGRWLGGRYAEKPAVWKEASPVYYVDSNPIPFLFINSAQDRFHVGRGETIQTLQQHIVYSEVHTFDDAPHSFWLFDPWYDNTAQYIHNFLDHIFERKN